MGSVNPDRIPIEQDIPLIFTPSSRDALALTKDAMMDNVYLDNSPDGQKWVTKRPGLGVFTTFLGGGAATGQGLWYYNNFLLAASNNTLTRVISGTSIGFTSGAAWSNTFNGPFPVRRAHATAVLNGQMFVMGGTYNGVFNLSDVWATRDGQNWAQLVSSAPWGLRAFMGCTVFNGRIYIMGGQTTDPTGLTSLFMNDVWSTADGVTWIQETTAAGWAPRTWPCCVTFNNGMWVFGGSSGTTDVWFSTDGSHWSQISQTAPWTNPGLIAGALTFSDKIWMIGGAVGARGRQVWWTIDGINWTQSTAAAFTTGRHSQGVCVYNNLMWAMNGFDGGYLSEVYSSPDGITWTLVTGGFGGTPRFQGTLTVFQAPPTISPFNATTMYYIGGSDVTPVYYNQIWWANLGGSLSTSYTITGTTTPFLPMQAVPSNNNQYLVLKDTRGAYIWYQNTILQVTDKNYPLVTVPGIVNLDETTYVMTPDALICGSTIGNPFVWPSRNFIGADYLSDGGVAIARYNNYVLALGVKSTQLFYNSGAPGPTLLRPVKNANSDVGCEFPYSVVETIGTVIWAGKNETAGRQVFMLDGLTPVPISCSLVERHLDSVAFSATEVKATAVVFAGHPHYILTTPFASFAFDIKTKMWFRWVYGGLPWAFGHFATDGYNNFCLSDTTNEIDALTLGTYLDRSIFTIHVVLQTPKIYNGTNCWKTCNRINLVMDRDVGSTVRVSYSDNDYQTFSAPRTLQVNAPRVSDTRWGRYRYRAWLIEHTANTNFRAQMLQTEFKVGNN